MNRIFTSLLSILPYFNGKIKEQKKTLRREIRTLKKYLDKDVMLKDAEKVFEKIAQTPEFYNAETVMIYWSTEHELPTHEIIERWAKDKTVLLPSIRHGGKMSAKQYLGNEDMHTGKYGISEPKTESFYGKIDLAIVPGVAFDKYCNRLGRGKGYYDRYLRKRNITAFGIGFDLQIQDKVPASISDYKLKRIITPNHHYKR